MIRYKHGERGFGPTCRPNWAGKRYRQVLAAVCVAFYLDVRYSLQRGDCHAFCHHCKRHAHCVVKPRPEVACAVLAGGNLLRYLEGSIFLCRLGENGAQPVCDVDIVHFCDPVCQVVCDLGLDNVCNVYAAPARLERVMVILVDAFQNVLLVAPVIRRHADVLQADLGFFQHHITSSSRPDGFDY